MIYFDTIFRRQLTSLKVMGSVPPIHFVKDFSQARVQQVKFQ